MYSKYYLHQKLKKKGIKYNSKNKTVYWNYNKPLLDVDVLLLQKNFHYSIQTQII